MKNPVISSIRIWMIGFAIFVSILQCTKDGFYSSKIDRSFNAIPDTTLFSPFYDITRVKDSDAVAAQINDIINVKGMQSTIKEYCGISTCHGGPIEPKFDTYAEITKYVTPGDPSSSKLWQRIVTNDLNEAMPPVAATHELTESDKTLIFNWIKNGAKEFPDLNDFRPAAIKIITTGCTSGNCHNIGTSTGAWARAGLVPGMVGSDTSTFKLVRSNGTTWYCQLSNASLRNSVWTAYTDSVRQYYSDTVGNASYRPFKTFSTPVVKANVRGPLSSYADILFDINYPKGRRSSGSPTYTSNGKSFYVFSDPLNGNSSLISRIDSTILPANVATGVYATTNSGDMAYSDGGLNPSEIAIIKAWYFADPSIPDLWKYGPGNKGIYKYKRSNTIITKH